MHRNRAEGKQVWCGAKLPQYWQCMEKQLHLHGQQDRRRGENAMGGNSACMRQALVKALCVLLLQDAAATS